MTQKLEERRDRLIPSSLELLMMVSGLEDSEMDLVFKNGRMVLAMKDNGKIIEHMEKESSFILMVMSMMENGLMTKQMDMVSIIILMEHSMKVTGEMIFNMVKEKNLGLMVLFTRVNTLEERNTV